MKSCGLVATAVAGAALFASHVKAATASTIDPIVIKGKHFFYKTNGTEFFMRGVAYQPDYIANASAATNEDYTDPLASITSCQRDIPYLVQLRTNVIRTYALNPTSDHSACMNALAAAGIYVISDLSAPTDSIDRNDPSWTWELYERYISLIDNMAQYNNVIGFFAGNEVANSENTTASSAFVKAAVRDTKAYIAAQGYRTMYVGYATYDGPIIDQLAEYFNCGASSSSVDFFGCNVYSWCGNSTYAASYQTITEFFANYNVPVFFAEYGCNVVQPRTFTDVPVLYGPEMAPVWSGGIVYMYFQETNDYGLVSVTGNTVSTLVDFNYLSSQLATVTPTLTAESAVATTFTPTTCPSVDATWSAVASPLPPSPNSQLCSCLVETLDCVVSSATSADAYGELFSYICAADSAACVGIQSNATSGVYGAYSGCSPAQQLSYVMNRYYIAQSSSSAACSFSGSATLVSGASATGVCSSLLSLAGTNGAGTVASPTANAAAQSSAASGTAAAGTGKATSASSTATATKKSAAGGLAVSTFDLGLYSVGLYVFGAALTGLGMIML